MVSSGILHNKPTLLWLQNLTSLDDDLLPWAKVGYTRHFRLCAIFLLTLRLNLKEIFTKLQQINFKTGYFSDRSNWDGE